MRRKIPLPLLINCDGLSKKLTRELADKLTYCFDAVECWGDNEIIAHKPRNRYFYSVAWHLIDHYGVTAT